MTRGIALFAFVLAFYPGIARAEEARPEDEAPLDSGSPRGVYFDTEGRLVPFRPTYDAWFRDHREPQFLRAAGEVVAWIGLGTGYYWFRADVNRLDWDRPNLADRLLFEAVRFDNNLGTTNYILHPLGGAAYYGFSRVNNLGVYWSLVYGFAASTIWEYAFEWRELVSINDMVFTPFGGVAMGEFFYQLGEYLNSASNVTLPRGVAAVALGWPRLVHRAIDGEKLPPPVEPDSLGYSSAFWHRFVLAYQYARVRNDLDAVGDTHNFIAEAEIVAMPGFLRPGRFAVNFENGNFTEMKMRGGFDETGWADVDLWFAANLLGRYAQDMEQRPGGLYGYGTMLALSTALRYSQHFLLGQRDEFAVSHIAGPSFRLWNRWGALETSVSANTHFDFASIVSLAYPDFVARFGEEGTKTSLQNQGYQFHLGGSGRLGVTATYEPLELGGYGSYGRYGSLQGLDRVQEEVTRDVPGTEQVLEYGAWVGFTAAPVPVYARVGAERYYRWSSLGDVSVRRWDELIAVTGGLSF